MMLSTTASSYDGDMIFTTRWSCRRFAVPVLFSLALHSVVVAGVLSASSHQTGDTFETIAPINVTLLGVKGQSEARAPSESKSTPFLSRPTPMEASPPQKILTNEREKLPEERKITQAEKKKPIKHREKKAASKTASTLRESSAPSTSVSPTSTMTDSTTEGSSSKTPLATQKAKQEAPLFAPKAIQMDAPIYPSRARALGTEGQVRVQYDVDPAGRVNNVRILFADPPDTFERAVKQAMKKWRYERGKPVRDLTMRVAFRMVDGASLE